MNVDYITHSGDDLLVVNAARVSFHKHHDEFQNKDKGLLRYLAKHGHWTPFSHPQITLRIKAPIFVARQLFKHQVGMTENEVSRRYVDDDPEFYYPDVWRGRPSEGAKQGSSGVSDYQIASNELLEDVHIIAKCCYEELLDFGVAPEQARMVLPQSMYTEWYWTGSLASYARVYSLRTDAHAQQESSYIAKKIGDIISPLFPKSWEVLTKYGNSNEEE